MRVDVRTFASFSVIDTCSIWNILSSKALLDLTDQSGVTFCCTQFVSYECLHKPRKTLSETEKALQRLLESQIGLGKFKAYPISIEDLQNVEVLSNRKKLSMGELSSMVFAKKTRQAFTTDDQGARKLSEAFLGLANTQTIPHLFGWLVYNGVILDLQKEQIVRQHEEMDRILGRHFEEIFLHALQLRLQDQGSK